MPALFISIQSNEKLRNLTSNANDKHKFSLISYAQN